MATTGFRAANVAGIDPWDLRSGRTMAGITGALKTNCRNGVNNLYNFDGFLSGLTIDAAATGVRDDFWDTIDDFDWPMQPIRKVADWSDDTFCDSTTFADVTTHDGGKTFTTCNNSVCIYRDKITEIEVTDRRVGGVSTTWSSALLYCAQSTYGGYPAGSWRLPTQKESMSLYNHGLNYKFNMKDWFWTATTYSENASIAWVHEVASGDMYNSSSKSDANAFYCIRGGASW